MDKERELELDRVWKEATKNAKIITGNLPRACGRSSLSQTIKTKEQADRFMRDLKICFGELIIIPAPKKSD